MHTDKAKPARGEARGGGGGAGTPKRSIRSTRKPLSAWHAAVAHALPRARLPPDEPHWHGWPPSGLQKHAQRTRTHTHTLQPFEHTHRATTPCGRPARMSRALLPLACARAVEARSAPPKHHLTGNAEATCCARPMYKSSISSTASSAHARPPTAPLPAHAGQRTRGAVRGHNTQIQQQPHIAKKRGKSQCKQMQGHAAGKRGQGGQAQVRCKISHMTFFVFCLVVWRCARVRPPHTLLLLPCQWMHMRQQSGGSARHRQSR
jgi:hypothetical protein